MQLEQSKQLFERASKSLVGGVNSPVRAFNSVGGNPLFIERGEGVHIYDVDGNEYIDLIGSYGPLILGHAHPKVTAAVQAAIQKSFTFGASTLGEVEMAELVKEAFPQLDKVRFVNSGTEAILSAIRLARAYSGKTKIVKFAGCYHGHTDALLVAAGSGLMTMGIPSSAGVPEEAVKDTMIAKFNNIESVKAIIEANKGEIAAVFIEPVAGNMGVVVPEQAFMKELREITQENNILLVIDEVMTGFRHKFGGAQDFFNIQADITCMGKVIGGGMPVGAYGAKAEIMDMVAPLGNVYQAGTLSGSPIAMACGLATLRELKQQDYKRADLLGKRIKACLEATAAEAGIDVKVNQFGLMVNPFFTTQEVTDFDTASSCDTELFGKFFWAMAEAGLYIPPSQFEAWFLPITITDDEMEVVEERIKKAFQTISGHNN
ncbi:MAG: glutamate-1-semialdehyde 2,1-aminomutase [Flavobacteriales bacterium]|nr:glutamate-1-semialdehyde 2,1-aminomutase [Flavobacteriales bacterium]